jgi:hypothetical protein
VAYGRKTGGRTPGTPNKKTVDLTAKIQALVDRGEAEWPEVVLARLCKDEDKETRGWAADKLMPYLHHRRIAIAPSEGDGSNTLVLSALVREIGGGNIVDVGENGNGHTEETGALVEAHCVGTPENDED